MNFLVISIFAVASLSIFPQRTLGTTDVIVQQTHADEPLEPPHALPLQAAASPNTGGDEVWQEDDREVLIRNERGTKNNSNGGSGKKEKLKKVKNSNAKPTTADTKPSSSKFLFYHFIVL